ncbi:MAG: CotH kinase family protein [Myxococcota bacterium]
MSSPSSTSSSGWEAPRAPVVPRVVVNELMAANDSSWQAASGAFPDWLELENRSDVDVDLGRVEVSDDSGETWTGPAGTALAPGARWLLVADDGGGATAPFRLSSEADRLVVTVDGVETDAVEVVDLQADTALARIPDGGDAWAVTIAPTPGEPNVASTSTDPSDPLFGDDQVLAFAIAVDPADEAALDVQGGPGVPGTLTYDGVTLDVTVKLKGSGTFQPLAGKPSFVLDVNDRVPGQRLRSLEAITLNNADHDPTYVREFLAYELFTAAGVPSPRAGFARVTYNGADYGLYVHVEAVDDVFLARWFADPSGMLLEGTPDADLDATWPLLDPDEGAVDAAFLDSLAAALADPTAPDAEAALDARVEVDAFATYAAIEAVAMHWDGYQNPKNWYVYLDPTTDRLWWIPHGTDWTWMKTWPIDHGDGAVFGFCLAVDGCRAAYRDALAEACDLADGLALPDRYLALRAWLAPEIASDPRNDDSPFTIDNHTSTTEANLRSRTTEVRAELADAVVRRR